MEFISHHVCVEQRNFGVLGSGKNVGLEFHSGGGSVVGLDHQQEESVVRGKLVDLEAP